MNAKVIDLSEEIVDPAKFCEVGLDVQLKHPATKEPLDSFIPIIGRDSATVQDYLRERINSDWRQDALRTKRGEDADADTIEGNEKDNIELCTVAIMGANRPWKNIHWGKNADGSPKELALTVTNVQMLLKERPWIRIQMIKAMNDTESFFQAYKQTLSDTQKGSLV